MSTKRNENDGLHENEKVENSRFSSNLRLVNQIQIV